MSFIVLSAEISERHYGMAKKKTEEKWNHYYTTAVTHLISFWCEGF